MTPAHRNLQFTFYLIFNIYANNLILNFRKKKKSVLGNQGIFRKFPIEFFLLFLNKYI